MSSRSAQRTRKNRGSSRDNRKLRSRTRGGNNGNVAKNLSEPESKFIKLMQTARRTYVRADDLKKLLAEPNVKNQVSKQTSKGLTALHEAVLGIVVNLSENLRRNGKNGRGQNGRVQNAVNNYYKHNAIDIQVEKIRQLIAAGADKTLIDAAGNTPVDLAMRIRDNQTKDKVLEALGFSSEVNAIYA